MNTKTKGTVVFLTPDVTPHDDATKIIGRKTRYFGDEHRYLHGYDVVIVAVLKNSLRMENCPYLTTDEDIKNAGGIDQYDRIEVTPIMPEQGGRLSFATSDPKATDLEAFRHVARRGAKATKRIKKQEKNHYQLGVKLRKVTDNHLIKLLDK